MAKVFTNQGSDANSSEQTTGHKGKAWVECEGGFGGGTVTVEKENPDGGFSTVTVNGTALSFTAPFAVAVDLFEECNLRLGLNGATSSTLDGWISPLS